MDLKIIVGTIVRGGVQAVAGVLVSKGVIDAVGAGAFVESVTAVVVGGVLMVGAYIWSLVSKQKALNTPVPKVGT
jgi:hypothetical protein